MRVTLRYVVFCKQNGASLFAVRFNVSNMITEYTTNVRGDIT